MEKKISILQGGSVYFFYRPKVKNNATQKEEVQRFFFVLQPQNQSKYQLLIVGKKQLPATEKDSYFLFLEAIKNNKEELLAALKNPQAATPPGVGLAEKQKVKFPATLQTKFAHYSFIPLSASEFLNYEGAELLLISKGKENLTSRTNKLESCLEKIHPDNLLDEFAKISFSVTLTPIKQ